MYKINLLAREHFKNLMKQLAIGWFDELDIKEWGYKGEWSPITAISVISKTLTRLKR